MTRAARDARGATHAAVALRRLLLQPLALVVALVAMLLPGTSALAAPAQTAEQAGYRLITAQTAERFRSESIWPEDRVVVGGLGSSVGAGATLEHMDRDAPVAWFAAALQRRFDPTGRTEWDVVNDSVGGSTIHDGLHRDWATLRARRPDVVVLAYGMNDGAPAQFETGQTFAGGLADLETLVREIEDSGALPVLLTTPGPHTARTDFSMPDRAVAQQPPVDTSEPVRTVQTNSGVAMESSRHAAVNEAMRRLGVQLGVDVVDVEPLWLQAVAARGEDALFNEGEFVHPNLLGHRLGYHAAIDDWSARLRTSG